MSEEKSNRVSLRITDILSAIENATSDLGDLSPEEFKSDPKTQRAVIQSLIVIGEGSLAAFAEIQARDSSFTT